MTRKQNYSRKREAILNALRGTSTHPSAEWIYLQLKNDFPDLSLGTVYRNLSAFKKDGSIVSLGVLEGQERFDGNVKEHSHFICKRCHAIYDIPSDPALPQLIHNAAHSLNARIEGCKAVFHGICSSCLKKQ